MWLSAESWVAKSEVMNVVTAERDTSKSFPNFGDTIDVMEFA